MIPAGLTPRDFNDSPRSESDPSPRGPASLFPDPSPRQLLSARFKKKASSSFNLWATGEAPNRLVTKLAPNGNRRLFRYVDDTASPSLKDQDIMLKAFKTALSTERFEATLNEMAQSLYQRKAQIDDIDRSHNEWSKTLEAAYENQIAAWTGADSFYKLIPLLEDPKKIAQALTCMITLEAIIPPLKLKYDALCCLLESPQHREALQFYKVMKRACKELRNKPTLEERVAGLSAILKKTEDKFEEKKCTLPGKDIAVVKQTSQLYEELIRFIKYTTNKITELKAPQQTSWGWSVVGYGWIWGTTATQPLAELDPEKTNSLIAPLLKRIEAIEGTLTASVAPSRRNQDTLLSIEDRTLAESYIHSCRNDTLHNEDDFRNGRALSTIKLIGPYRELIEPVAKLRDIAKALTRLLATLKERRVAICEGNTEPCGDHQSLQEETYMYEKLVKSLMALIGEQQEAITKLPLTNRVHAGWYYVARLFVKANDVRMHIDQFKKLARNDFISYSTSIKEVVEYLDPQERDLVKDKEYFTGAIATERLWVSLQSTCQLIKPLHPQSFSEKLRCKIHETIDQILAKTGPRTLALTKEELKIPKELFAKAPLKAFWQQDEEDIGILPKALVMYLLKGFLKDGYFTDAELDPQFELALCTLLTDPLYEAAFSATIEKTATFKTHFTSYLARSDIHKYSLEIQYMSDILTTLSATEQSGSIETLFSYCQARQLLNELHVHKSKITSVQQQQRLAWIEDEATTTFKNLENLYPVYFQHFEAIDTTINQESSLYKCIAIHLHATSEEARIYAYNRIIEIIKNFTAETLPQDPHLNDLLRGWALEQLMLQNNTDIPHLEKLLSDLFAGYLTNDNTRDLWRGLYGIGFMETALYRFTLPKKSRTRELYYILKTLHNNRDTEHHTTWQSVLKNYQAFTSHLQEHRNSLIHAESSYDNLHAYLHTVKAQFADIPIEIANPETKTYLGVARWCCMDMLSKYTFLRFDQFNALIAKQPNKIFFNGTNPHKQAEAIKTELLVAFGEQIAFDGNTPHPHPDLQEARNACFEVIKTFQFQSFNINPLQPEN